MRRAGDALLAFALTVLASVVLLRLAVEQVRPLLPYLLPTAAVVVAGIWWRNRWR